MKDSRFIEIIEECTNNFIDSIAYELEESHDRFMEDFGFPMFGETSKEYHEQVYFQSYLEAYTRTMINAILKGVAETEHVYDFRWPELDYFGIYRGYTNKECEKKFGFEMINTDLKIGYKYVPVYYDDEIEPLLIEHGVETINIVEWEGAEYTGFIKCADKRVNFISPKELFWQILGGLDDLVDMDDELCRFFGIFNERVSEAVMKANSMISLVTLPGFTSSYLYKNKEEYINDFVNEIRKLSSFKISDEKYKKTECDSEKLITDYKLPSIFLDRKMENAFVGVSRFAKCFLTSEYLFRHFKNNNIFDYTPIVSGYLKSIEQILQIICENYRNTMGIQLDMSRYTIGDYISFIQKNDLVFQQEIRPAKQIIIDCLLGCASSRNELFHRHYCDTWDKVETIRSNTYFLYAVLMGSVELSILERDPRRLGIVNDDYNKLFRILESQNSNYYTLVVDGKEYKGMEKEPRREGLTFNGKGIILNRMTFKRLDYDHWIEINIACYRIPTDVWVTDSFGGKIKKIW